MQLLDIVKKYTGYPPPIDLSEEILSAACAEYMLWIKQGFAKNPWHEVHYPDTVEVFPFLLLGTEHIDVIRRFEKSLNEYNLSYRDIGYPAAEQAIRYGNVEAYEFLWDLGITETDDGDVCLLHAAVESTNALKAIHCLMGKGVLIDFVSPVGDTPLFWAVEAGCDKETLVALMEYGANPAHRNIHGEDVLTIAEDLGRKVPPFPKRTGIRSVVGH